MIAPPLTRYGIARTTMRNACAPGMNSTSPHRSWSAMNASANPSHCSSVAETEPSSPLTSYVRALDGSHGLDIHPGQVEQHLLVALEHASERELRRTPQACRRQLGPPGLVPQQRSHCYGKLLVGGHHPTALLAEHIEAAGILRGDN